MVGVSMKLCMPGTEGFNTDNFTETPTMNNWLSNNCPATKTKTFEIATH
jgi:hypothetical protein